MTQSCRIHLVLVLCLVYWGSGVFSRDLNSDLGPDFCQALLSVSVVKQTDWSGI